MGKEADAVMTTAPLEKNTAPVLAEFPDTRPAGPQQDMDEYLAEHDTDDAAYGDFDEPEEPDETPEDAESEEAEVEPADAETEAAEQPAPKAEDEQDDTYSADEYEKALAAIRRDGLDPDSLRWGRKRLIEHGLKRSKFYADQQETYRTQQEQLKELKERAASAKELSGNATPADEPLDLNGALEPFRAELGEASAAALQKVLQTWHGNASAANKALRAELEQTQNIVVASLYESARGRVRERFPDIAKPDVWTKAVPRVRALMESGSYESLDDAITDVSKGLDLKDAQAAARQEKDERADAAKAKGTPTGSKRRAKTPPSAKTDQELETDMLDQIEKAHGWED